MDTTFSTRSTTGMSTKDTHLISVDVLRISAAFLVVLGHVTAPFAEYEVMETWRTASVASLFYGPFCILSIPIFIMLSGMLLLEKNINDNIMGFYKRRINKVLIPMIVWILIYYGYNIISKGEAFSLISFMEEFLVGWKTDHIPWHLWYLPMILSLYVFAPMIKTITEHVDRTVLMGFVLVMFVYECILPLIGEFFQIELGLYTYRTFSSIYLFYFMLGYTLNSGVFDISPRALTAMFWIGFFTSWLGSVFAYSIGYDMSLIGIARLNTVIMAVSVFLLMKKGAFVIKSSRIQGIVRELGRLSFGVYLIHILMIDTLTRGDLGVKITPYFIHPLIGIPIQAIAAFALSIVAVYFMRRIPLIRAIVP